MKLSEHSAADWILFRETLKACVLYDRLLSEFERDIADNFIARYRQFGADVNIEPKQLKTLREIAIKLGVLP